MEKAELETKYLAEALQRKIRESSLSYGALERRLGMGRDTLRHVLSGRVELKVRHVFGILAALDVHPKAFFIEHLRLPVTLEDFYRHEHLVASWVSETYRYTRAGFDLIASTLKEKGMLSDAEVADLIQKLRRLGKGFREEELDSP